MSTKQKTLTEQIAENAVKAYVESDPGRQAGYTAREKKFDKRMTRISFAILGGWLIGPPSIIIAGVATGAWWQGLIIAATVAVPMTIAVPIVGTLINANKLAKARIVEMQR